MGDRVVTTPANPDVVDPSADDPEPATWRFGQFRLSRPDGSALSIHLLRPADWFENQGMTPGRIIRLDLPGMGVSGPARVVAVGDCPTLGPGPGRVVIGTFLQEVAGGVLELRIERLDESLGVTGNHPVFSLDRLDFVPAGELKVGERLLPLTGSRGSCPSSGRLVYKRFTTLKSMGIMSIGSRDSASLFIIVARSSRRHRASSLRSIQPTPRTSRSWVSYLRTVP